MNNFVRAMILASCLLAGVTACTVPEREWKPSSTPTATETQKELLPGLTDSDTLYLEYVSKKAPEAFASMGQQRLLDKATFVCDALSDEVENYQTYEISRSVARYENISGSDADVIVGSAIGAYCPEEMP